MDGDLRQVVAQEKTREKFSIIVNGRHEFVESNVLTFVQVVSLAGFPDDPNVLYRVSYKNAAGGKEGILDEGDSVTIKNGTIFTVTPTNRS